VSASIRYLPETFFEARTAEELVTTGNRTFSKPHSHEFGLTVFRWASSSKRPEVLYRLVEEAIQIRIVTCRLAIPRQPTRVAFA